MPTEKEQVTIGSYDRLAKQWIEAHQDTNVFDLAFPKFQQYLPAGEILEVGSAGGRDGIKIKRAGYGYIGMDITPGLIEEAKTLYPKLKFVQGNICDPPHFGVKFDGIWCAATLIHLPKSKVEKALTSMHGLLRTDGIGYISLKEGEGDMVYEEEKLDGELFRRHTTFYQLNEFADLLEDNHFHILESYQQQVSSKTTWLNYFIQK